MVTYERYKGNNIIVLHRGEGDQPDRYPFSFGIGKAQLILKHIKEIEAFVEKYGRGDQNDDNNRN